jgi:lipoprotein-anchoring transpeptidase ErfK/SrfK
MFFSSLRLLVAFVAFALSMSFAQATQIVVGLDQHKLWLVDNKGYVLATYPIAAPKRGMETGTLGEWTISRKAECPTWTPSEELMERLPEKRQYADGIPGCTEENPMGVAALYLGDSLLRIHGTNAPDSIGTNASSGCIRMLNEDIQDLYSRVPAGTKVLVQRKIIVEDVPHVASARSDPLYGDADGIY